MNEQERNQRERDKQAVRTIADIIKKSRDGDALLSDFTSVAFSSYMTGFVNGVRADKSIQTAAV